jgi:TPR repeat protein
MLAIAVSGCSVNPPESSQAAVPSDQVEQVAPTSTPEATPTLVAQTNVPTPEEANEVPQDPVAEGVNALKESDFQKAYTLLMPKAIEGDAEAQVYVGLLFLFNNDAVTSNIQTAEMWIEKSAKQGNLMGLHYLGYINNSCNAPFCDEAVAIQNYQMAAEKGYIPSQVALAWMYYRKPFEPSASERVMYWFGKAAESGSLEAKIALAEIYYEGRLVSADYGKALAYLKEVVDQRNTKAIDEDTSQAKYLLGMMYAKGLGVAKDEAMAFHWFREAVQEGEQASYGGKSRYYDVVKRSKEAMEKLGTGTL